jgi:hypothetical protein
MQIYRIITSFLAVLFLTSCNFCDSPDASGSTTSLFIENKTDADVEVVYKKSMPDTAIVQRLQINKDGKVRVFTFSSGMQFRDIDSPDFYDTVYIYYKDEILKESIAREGLLDANNYALQEKETYKKKCETYYTRIFTIDEAYINSHLQQ